MAGDVVHGLLRYPIEGDLHVGREHSLAVHLKLDEIIRVIDAADDKLIRAEDETDENLNELKEKYQALVEEADALRREVGEEAEARRQDGAA
jgi:prefoldin subunit 5